MIVVALRLADFASNVLIGRPVNLSLDLMLLPAILEVLSGSASWLELTAAFILVPVALAVLFAMNLGAIRMAARFLKTPINRPALRRDIGGDGDAQPWRCRAFAPLDQGAAALLAGQAADMVQASTLRAEYLNQFRQDPFAGLSEGCFAGPSGTARCLCHVLRVLWRNDPDQPAVSFRHRAYPCRV